MKAIKITCFLILCVLTQMQAYANIDYSKLEPLVSPTMLTALFDSKYELPKEEATIALFVYYCRELDAPRPPVRPHPSLLAMTTDQFKISIVRVMIAHADINTLNQIANDGKVRKDVRDLALCVLAANGDPRHRGKVKTFLQSEDVGMQFCAIRAVAQADIHENIPVLKDLEKSDLPKECRNCIQGYLRSKSSSQPLIDDYVEYYRDRLEEELKKEHKALELPAILYR